jgi:putative transposase
MARSDAHVRLLDASLVAALVHGADPFGGNVKHWCETNKVSRSTAYRHRQRVAEAGSWRPRSTRPRSRARNATPLEVEAEVVRLRSELVAEPGQDCGAENVRYYLQQLAELDDWTGKGWRVPSRATIHKILLRAGLVVREPRKRPKSSYRRFAYARPRDCYQIDATEVALADGRKVVVFEVLDDCTRLLAASLAWPAETADGAVAAINTAIERCGAPGLVLSDNGSAFTARLRRGGTSRFTRVVTATGARLIHSSPYHPQTCGKVERHHRTFKAWLADQPTPATLNQLQALCECYQDWYNTRRRHSASNQPPQQAWDEARAYGGPSELPVQSDAEVKVVTVDKIGKLHLHGYAVVAIGRRHAHQRITVILDADRATLYAPDGLVLGHVIVDPTRRHQTFKPAA